MRKLFILLVLSALYSLGFPASAAAAARLYFEPSQKNLGSGETLSVTVKIDTGGADTKGANASIYYPTDKFEFVGVGNGNFYDDAQTNSDPGKGWIYLDGMQTTPTNKNGTGDLGSFNLKAISNGTAKITINCGESSILGADNKNILDCSSTSSGEYTIGPSVQQVEPTATPKPDTGGGGGGSGDSGGAGGNTQPAPPTATPPSKLPKSGEIGDTIKAIGVGIGSVIIGLAILL